MLLHKCASVRNKAKSPLLSRSSSNDSFSSLLLQASFITSFSFCSISFFVPVLFFISSCYSHFLMFIFPAFSLSKHISLSSLQFCPPRGGLEKNIKAIHNLEDILSAISIPTSSHTPCSLQLKSQL